MTPIPEILKSAREIQNLSIEELSERTKVRKAIIIALEKGEFDSFQELYLRAYIRNLAKELKILDSDEFREAYDDFIKTYKPQIVPTESTKEVKKITVDDYEQPAIPSGIKYDPSGTETKHFKTKTKLNVNFLIYAFIVILLTSVLIITFYPFDDNNNQPTNTNQTETSSKPLEISNNKNSNSGNNNILEFFQKSDSLILKAEVTDSVWFYINIDGKNRKQMLLLPKQNYHWSASQYFLVTHGNSKKIKLFLNDKQLDNLAGAGTVARDIKITRNGIELPPKTPVYDTTKPAIKPKLRNKKKETKEEIRFIEPSPIENLKPPIKK